MSRQSSSDPLPFVQVDRAVKPKAALLAGKMGVTNQHALGSLIEFWDLCGDPRELEHVVAETLPGEEPALVLDRADVELRFELASGHHIEVGVLALAGLVEPHAKGFRVRGMSRYFDPIQARLRARGAASAGGKSRMSKARRGPDGRLIGAGGSAGESASVDQPTLQPDTSRLTSREPADDQPTTSPIGQRSAVSGHLLEDLPVASRRGGRKPAQAELVPTPPDPRHQPLIEQLVATFERVRGAKYPFDGRDAKAVKALLALADPPDIDAAWARALAEQKFPVTSTLSELLRNLAHFLGAKPATSKDWRSQTTDYAAAWGVEP